MNYIWVLVFFSESSQTNHLHILCFIDLGVYYFSIFEIKKQKRLNYSEFLSVIELIKNFSDAS